MEGRRPPCSPAPRCRPALPERLGLPAGHFTTLDVGSPFDYEHPGLLYCAAHLPDPRSARFDEAAHDELAALIEAAGGRTLALFTSYRALEAAVEALPAPAVGGRSWPRASCPSRRSSRRFTAEPETCLFATMGFWQGIDVPGETLILVTIDRLPFPRPDDPLLQARRERARADAFRTIDLPRAATLLAQGAGRLIRTRHRPGRGGGARSPPGHDARYRWELVPALPPMRRTKDRAEVEAFLRSLRGDAPSS